MGSTTLVPLSEYLHTMYRPDCDYLEGHALERNFGERPHAKLQSFFSRVFETNEDEWGTVILPEQRVQVREAGPEVMAQRRKADPSATLRDDNKKSCGITTKRAAASQQGKLRDGNEKSCGIGTRRAAGCRPEELRDYKRIAKECACDRLS